jgi:hypothetical protein
LKASEAAPHNDVECEVDDYGEFENPTEVMEELPAGWEVELIVSRSLRDVHPIPGDLYLIATGEASSIGEHLLEE